MYILCSFCVQSGKFYTWQNIFTRAPPVVPVTIMRYAHGWWGWNEEILNRNPLELSYGIGIRERSIICYGETFKDPRLMSCYGATEQNKGWGRAEIINHLRLRDFPYKWGIFFKFCKTSSHQQKLELWKHPKICQFSSLHENADCRCFHPLNGRNTSRALSKSPPHKWKPSFEEEENRVRGIVVWFPDWLPKWVGELD